MRDVSGLRLVLAALVLAGGSLPCDAQPRPADPGAVPLTVVARSALVSLEASATPAGLALRLRRAADQAPVPVTRLTVSVEGRSAPAAALADGSWSVTLPRPVAAGDALEVVVAHDGISEILGGRFAAPGKATPASAPSPGGTSAATLPGAGSANASPAGGIAGYWRAHKQTAWWILNVVIVLIAAIAISRRMS